MKSIKTILLALLMVTAIINVRAQTPAANAAINKVIASYIEVKNALVADDGKTAESKAKILNAQISAVPVKELSAAQQGVWRNYADKLSFDSRHISETEAIDHQRGHFASLSKNLYAVVKAIKVNSSAIYWEYCPMKKSSWLSDKQAIENPYYGKAMADCGSVKETIKAAK